MPSYLYEIIDNQGRTKKEVSEAASESALVERLQSEGYFVVKVALAKAGEKVKPAAQASPRDGEDLKFAHDKCSLEDLVVFSRQLATMLEAGVTMLRSLSVIITQIQSRQLYMAVAQAHRAIEQGASLSAALAKNPKVFDQFWISLAEVGEASGTMPQVLNKLADHVEQENAFRSTIISAVVYPIILFVVCIAAVVFFAMVVGPKFEDIFNSMHADLPLITKILLGTFNFIKSNILLLIGGTVGFFIFARGYISTPMGRVQWEQFLFSLPVIGQITKLIVVERFAAQMAILMDSGVPILFSLEITEKLVDNKICSTIISKVREKVREGTGMADALKEEGFFPMMAVQMIKVGEETGELGKMLKHVAKFYQDNVEAFMKRFGTLIEPFMLVFMATVIGTIVVAIFLPLFKLSQMSHHT